MRLLFTTFLILCIYSCTVPVRHYITPPDDKDTTATVPDTVSSFIQSNEPKKKTAAPLLATPVTEWPGKLFYVLPKQELLRANGYELFACKPPCSGTAAKQSWELPNHRIMCDSIAGDTLRVESVEPSDDEWVVTFSHVKSRRPLYGRTHRHCIQEICLLADLSNAKSRWQATFVFSKRGIISIPGTNTSASIASKKVRILDSLLVTGVTFGQTPLPVKPLWLSVVMPSTGVTGFIPIRYSWTNTLADQITATNPWDEDIFDVDPRSYYDWDEYTWEVINNHRVILQMTPDQVRLSWGSPETVLTDTSTVSRETWQYPSHECTFVNGALAAISERK